MVKVSASRVGVDSHLCHGDFLGRHTSDLKNGTPVATLLGPGIIGSALGLVGLV